MYAIFKDGGHQYKAEVGQKLEVELRDVKEGDIFEAFVTEEYREELKLPET